MVLLRAQRRLPIGAEVVAGGVSFRVWAPGHRTVTLIPDDNARRPMPLVRDGGAGGYWQILADGWHAGDRYRFSVDDRNPVPDPASRFQPSGPHGPSEVVDPSGFAWSDVTWRGPDPTRDAIEEVHIGSFTREGTFAAAARRLEGLRDLGIGIVELLPLAEFPGRFGWGYDGVDLFAPVHLYGAPDDVRRFLDRAHALGLGVILDVVYNHLGPDGSYVTEFSDTFFSRSHSSEWGESPNFDGPGSDGVRDLVLANVRMWIEEYHFDGLRLDATQQIFDESPRHILADITAAVRNAAGGRRTLVVAENEPQETRLVRAPQHGGFGIDALWNDDVHHSAIVALTGRSEAYYSDYRGSPQELLSAARHGYLFQGQRYRWQGARRGTSGLDLSPSAFVAYLQNHDQVANSARGERISALTSPGRLRALTAYLLLAPPRPMLFMGQEWAASTPFTFFADHGGGLAEDVDRGRREFLRQFPSLAEPSALAVIPNPGEPATFEVCRLDHGERESPVHAAWLALHRDLLALRRSWRTDDEADQGDTHDRGDGAARHDRTDRDAGSIEPYEVDGAVLADAAFCLRFFRPGNARGQTPDERLLIVNLGAAVELSPAPEPLLAPPAGFRWALRVSTDDPRYGGPGAPGPETDEGWRLPAEAAVILEPKPATD